jgi:hypothetical protein
MRSYNNITFYYLFIIQILLASNIRAGTIILRYDGGTVKDAEIISSVPDWNGGNNDWGNVTFFSSNYRAERTYFQIPIPSFITPDLASSITQAKFKVYFSGLESGPFNISLNEVKKYWKENEICWSNKPEHNPGAEDSITLTSRNVWVEFNITNLVKRWVARQDTNYGFVLKPLLEGYPVQDLTTFWTSDYADRSLRPIIEITSSELPDSTIEAVTSIMDNYSNGISDLQLFQNYPNPFNPSTTIKFSLPKTSHVIINIFNSLGQEVARPISRDMNPGIYSTEWNASGFASGVYYYKMVAGDYIQTKKLILLK